MDWLVTLDKFRRQLENNGARFSTGLSHGTMRVDLYKPLVRDTQAPHAQDELYIVLQGSGTFSKAGISRSFKQGDVLFVEAQTEHRFETFSGDFETWVIFWGPENGEIART